MSGEGRNDEQRLRAVAALPERSDVGGIRRIMAWAVGEIDRLRGVDEGPSKLARENRRLRRVVVAVLFRASDAERRAASHLAALHAAQATHPPEWEVQGIRDALHAAQLRSADLEAKAAAADDELKERLRAAAHERDLLLRELQEARSAVSQPPDLLIPEDARRPAGQYGLFVDRDGVPLCSGPRKDSAQALQGNALEDMLVARVADERLQEEVDSLKRRISAHEEVERVRLAQLARLEERAHQADLLQQSLTAANHSIEDLSQRICDWRESHARVRGELDALSARRSEFESSNMGQRLAEQAEMLREARVQVDRHPLVESHAQRGLRIERLGRVLRYLRKSRTEVITRAAAERRDHRARIEEVTRQYDISLAECREQVDGLAGQLRERREYAEFLVVQLREHKRLYFEERARSQALDRALQVMGSTP